MIGYGAIVILYSTYRKYQGFALVPRGLEALDHATPGGLIDVADAVQRAGGGEGAPVEQDVQDRVFSTDRTVGVGP